jgi:hypothetical protein
VYETSNAPDSTKTTKHTLSVDLTTTKTTKHTLSVDYCVDESASAAQEAAATNST